jgi:protein-L-isoaspartate O-methyltransferase
LKKLLLELYIKMKYNYCTKTNEEPEDQLRIVLKALGKKNKETKKPEIIPQSHKEMVEILEEATKGINFNHRILDAIAKYDRSKFFDWSANPINEGTINPYTFMAPIYAKNETIPSPHIILSQLNDLEIKEGDDILEIGAGSAYNAIIAAQSAEKITVHTVEIDPELTNIARANVSKHNMEDKVLVTEAKELGIPGKTFDKIYSSVAATSSEQVETLLDQLRVGGKLRLPIVKIGNTQVIAESRLWNPGEEIDSNEIYMSDPSRGFTRQAAYLFTKIDEKTIEYKVVVKNAIGPNLK